MAFDSTVGGTTANAYVTVAYVDAYHADRGNTDWRGGTTAKQRAIIRATDYIDSRFGRRFRGVREGSNQSLEWPRLDAYDNDRFMLDGTYDQIPRQLQRACAEYARIALVADGNLLEDNSSSSTTTGEVVEESVKVGPIEETKKFAGAATRSQQSGLVSDSGIPEYPIADVWLEELLRSSLSRRIRRV